MKEPEWMAASVKEAERALDRFVICVGSVLIGRYEGEASALISQDSRRSLIPESRGVSPAWVDIVRARGRFRLSTCPETALSMVQIFQGMPIDRWQGRGKVTGHMLEVLAGGSLRLADMGWWKLGMYEF